MIDERTLALCRTVNLYDLLIRYDRMSWRKQGGYLRNIYHDSCVVERVTGHWFWNSVGKNGRNPISFMQSFYGLSFTKAIKVICDAFQISNGGNYSSTCPISTPKPCKQPWPELYNYLCNVRMLDRTIIVDLVKKGHVFLAEFKAHKNIVFANPDSKHFELLGIGITRFKQCSDADDCWSFSIGNAPMAYVCESAIDAVSLYELLKNDGTYLSVCGSANRKKLIEKVNKEYKTVILAVDNDDAGNKVSELFPDLPRLIPKYKDWNEDLKYKKLHLGELNEQPKNNYQFFNHC